MSENLNVDFTLKKGLLRKRLHSSNAPTIISEANIEDFTEKLRALNMDSCRTHDWALLMHGQRVVDTHFVFPLEHLDPADPSNYYFAGTDEAIKECEATGMKIYYRLGTSIEHTKSGTHFNTLVPKDFHHYAEILAGIVRHYARGWANGPSESKIEYWEIWNEANLGQLMWTGTMEEFSRFFAIVLKRLKSEFPELKIGGPAYTHIDKPNFKLLLEECRKLNVTPDFISWHCYAADPDFLIKQPAEMRAFLDENGFQSCEIHFNEWHFLETWTGLHLNVTPEGYRNAMSGPAGMHGIDSGVFNLAVLTGWHDTPLTAAFYYGAGIDGTWGYRTLFKEMNKNYFSLKLFGEMLKECPNRVSAPYPAGTVRLLAGLSDDGKQGALLLSDYRGSDMKFSLNVKGMENARVSAVVLSNEKDNAEIPVSFDGKTLVLEKPEAGSAAFLVKFEL